MIVRRYRPAFFSEFESEWATVGSLEELLAVPWIEHWKCVEGFRGYCWSTEADQTLLMAEFNDGLEWWVIAKIDDGTPIKNILREWKPPKEIE